MDGRIELERLDRSEGTALGNGPVRSVGIEQYGIGKDCQIR